MRRGHFHQEAGGGDVFFDVGDEGALGLDGGISLRHEMSRHYKNPVTRDGAHCKPVEGCFVHLPGKSRFSRAAKPAVPSAFDNVPELRQPENSLPEKYLTASIHVKCEVLLSHIHNYKGAS
ncbi:hypothetical protein [Simplicispira suum]|uniref:hypothetical protein n=1 Tax=Simplicispira suum TaxID=2109915 RepID=UPI0014762CDB|nr:hypothetical protein [Simplicispira suum]MBW7832090.1 hypothetical protein [Simplicispira suum]